MENARRRGWRSLSGEFESSAHNNGTSANHAKTLRQGGIGPASGNGNSSKQAESPAAAHGFAPDVHDDCIHRRV
jgi:hypothetical protein